MPTAQQIRDDVDARLAARLPAVRARQTTHLNARGVYAQILRTHNVDPEDGALVAPDRLTARPHYQIADTQTALGAALIAALGSMPFSLEIHQYSSPSGLGWIAYLRVRVLGDTWLRVFDNGPENRSQPWARVVPMGGV